MTEININKKTNRHSFNLAHNGAGEYFVCGAFTNFTKRSKGML